MLAEDLQNFISVHVASSLAVQTHVSLEIVSHPIKYYQQVKSWKVKSSYKQKHVCLFIGGQ